MGRRGLRFARADGNTEKILARPTAVRCLSEIKFDSASLLAAVPERNRSAAIISQLTRCLPRKPLKTSEPIRKARLRDISMVWAGVIESLAAIPGGFAQNKHSEDLRNDIVIIICSWRLIRPGLLILRAN